MAGWSTLKGIEEYNRVTPRASEPSMFYMFLVFAAVIIVCVFFLSSNGDEK